jgi:transcription elongation GreA/GreB family factor
MSRAFVKESDGEDLLGDLPERPLSPHANLVTARGLALIEAEIERLRQSLAAARDKDDRAAAAAVARDLRYFNARRASAELVPPPGDSDVVRFGMRVRLERDDGRMQTFRIVGEDEADPAAGLISYVSPLALALIGRAVGDVVTAGQGEAEILSVEA